jgi:hypothetical protein
MGREVTVAAAEVAVGGSGHPQRPRPIAEGLGPLAETVGRYRANGGRPFRTEVATPSLASAAFTRSSEGAPQSAVRWRSGRPSGSAIALSG